MLRNLRYLNRLPSRVITSCPFSIGIDVCFHMIPHPEKAAKGGEDACFIADNKCVLGIADGVGGWAESGVDPAVYAREIMKRAENIANSCPAEPPEAIMHQAYEQTKSIGSSTEFDAIIRISNLGDSGYCIVRPREPSTQDSSAPCECDMIARSKEQTWGFNAPYQLGTASEFRPHHANTRSFTALAGDILILGTDGLFDNLSDRDILGIVKDSAGLDAKKLSKVISQRAFEASQDENRPSPFSIAAKNVGYNFPGGKPDDITVLIARLVDVPNVA